VKNQNKHPGVFIAPYPHRHLSAFAAEEKIVSPGEQLLIARRQEHCHYQEK
jgi:hypothetical protein